MSSNCVTETSSNCATEVQILGRVKWFNNKAGYGFITVTDGARSGSDIFVHHSGIKVSKEQYRYLVQGEYVQFILDNTPSGAHEVQAKSVGGINGGMLMCETRSDFRQTRISYKTDNTEAPKQDARNIPSVTPRAARAPRSNQNQAAPRERGAGPREGKEWTITKNTAPRRNPTTNA